MRRREDHHAFHLALDAAAQRIELAHRLDLIASPLDANRRVGLVGQAAANLGWPGAQVGVPPLDNVQQIRILPAGGNIRVMSSFDAQIRIWRLLATAVFVDAGMIANEGRDVTTDDIRPIDRPFGAGAAEYAIPLRPQLGDDPRGRWHISFAARAQF